MNRAEAEYYNLFHLFLFASLMWPLVNLISASTWLAFSLYWLALVRAVFATDNKHGGREVVASAEHRGFLWEDGRGRDSQK